MATTEVLLLAETNLLLHKPIAAIRQYTTQSVPASTWTPIAMQVTITDTYGGWSIAAPTRYVALIPGWYDISGVVCWSNAQTTGFRTTLLAVNGNRIPGSLQDSAASGDWPTVASKPVQVYLAVGDYVEVHGWTSVASSTATANLDLDSRLDVIWAHA